MDEDHDIEYSDVIKTLDADSVPFHEEDDHLSGIERRPDRTLLDLEKGENKDAAANEIADKCFTMGVIHNFVQHRLVNSSGGPSPHIFNTSTGEYMERYPAVNVRSAGGRPPPFDNRNHNMDSVADDMNPSH